jgi:hypothetical protein
MIPEIKIDCGKGYNFNLKARYSKNMKLDFQSDAQKIFDLLDKKLPASTINALYRLMKNKYKNWQ